MDIFIFPLCSKILSKEILHTFSSSAKSFSIWLDEKICRIFQLEIHDVCGVCGVCGSHQVWAASCSACTSFNNCMHADNIIHTHPKHVSPVFPRLRWRVPLCYRTSHDHVDQLSSWLAITSIQLLAGKSLINYWFPLKGDWWLTHWAANSARDLQRASCPLFLNLDISSFWRHEKAKQAFCSIGRWL